MNYLRVKVHALCIGRMETTAHIWGPYILATGIGRLSASSKSLKESMKDYKPRKIERRDVDAGDGGKVLRYFLEYTDEVYISIPPGRKLNVLSENLTVKEMQDLIYNFGCRYVPSTRDTLRATIKKMMQCNVFSSTYNVGKEPLRITRDVVLYCVVATTVIYREVGIQTPFSSPSGLPFESAMEVHGCSASIYYMTVVSVSVSNSFLHIADSVIPTVRIQNGTCDVTRSYLAEVLHAKDIPQNLLYLKFIRNKVFN